MKRGYGKEVYCDKQVYFLHEIMTKNKKRDATSTTFLQHFYNKSQVVSCYWFKFETNTKITFLL